MFKSKIFVGLCSLALLQGSSGCCPAKRTQATVPLIPREVLFGSPDKVSPRLSPDGRQLAYLAPDQENVLNVWVKDLAGFGEAQLITADKKRGIRAFFWAYDEKSILYIQDVGGDENWHLYQTDLQTKITRDLTPFQGAQATVLAYEPQFPNEIIVQLNARDPALFDVYRINLETGSAVLEVENNDNVLEWLTDHELHVRASSAYTQNGDTIIRVRDDQESPWRELVRWGADENGQLLSFSPDGSSLYLFSTLGANTARLIKMSLIDGSKEILAEDPKYDLLGAAMINRNSHVVEAVGVMRDRLEWIVLDPKIKQDFAILNKPNETLAVVSRDLSDQHWIVQYCSDIHSGHFYLYDRANKKNRFLFSASSALENYPLSKMTPISFKARDGMELHGYLTLPLGKEPKNLPSLLFVHGGPWARDSWGYSPYAQWLANRGYAVLQVNFRGSTGYGKGYLNAGNREWAGKMQTDLLDGKQWIMKQGYADPEKIAIFGGSYGGYATLVGLAFTPEEFCCGVDIVGPSNLITLFHTMPPYWGPFVPIFKIRVGNPDTDRAFLESISPLFKADQISRPLLIAQGANDPRVKQSESDQIVAAMRRNGKEVEYLVFPDEGHGFVRPENRLKFCAAAETFLHKYLEGRSESP